MHRVLAIIENTFKEGLRQRILILLLIFAILAIVISIFVAPFALGEAAKIVRDMGLAAASLFGVLVVIIIGSSLIHKDIEKRTIYTVITKPVRRAEIIIGKFLGLFLLIFILQCSMTVIQQLIIFVFEGIFDLPLLLTLPFSSIEVMILISILLVFSSFSSPTLSSIMGIIFYIIGHASPDLKLFADQVKIPLLKYLAYIFYYIFPNLENLNYRLDLVHGLPLHPDMVLFSLCYGLIYTILLLYIAIIIFEKREFK
jgi:ABC-type transport system involved in multi-copper enzyme maturation permease subunit